MNSNNKRIFRNIIIIIAIIILSIVLYKTMGINYAVCDDTAMRNIASGAQTGTPDAHLVYMLYPIGLLISSLYKLNSSFDWYGIVLLVLQLICIYRITIKILDHCKNNKETIVAVFCFLVLFLTIWIKSFVSFQFSTTAAILGGTACFILHYSYKNEEVDIKDILESLFFMLLAIFVRFRVAKMTMPFYVLILAYYNFDYKQLKIKSIKNLFPIPFFIFAILFVTPLNNLALYSSDEWKDYKAYNLARSDIYDYYGVPDYQENLSFYNEIGISETDYVALSSYSLKLNDNITTEKLQKVATKSKEIFIKSKGNFVKRTVQTFNETINVIINAKYLQYWLWIIVIMLLQIYLRNNEMIIFNFLVLSSMIFGFFYLCWQGRMPQRTNDAIFLVGCLLLSVELIDFKYFINIFNNKSKMFINVFIACIMLFCSVDATYYTWVKVRDDRYANQSIVKLNEFFRENSNNYYCVMVNVGMFSYASDFHFKYSHDSSNYIGLGGWGTKSPVTYKKLELSGMTDISDNLVHNDNCYLMTYYNYDTTSLQKMLESKYGTLYYKSYGIKKFGNLKVNIIQFSVNSFDDNDSSINDRNSVEGELDVE